MINKSFYQSHECEGFRAKVTIEWSIPEHIEETNLPQWRMEDALNTADNILSYAAPKIRNMVQSMRGFKCT